MDQYQECYVAFIDILGFKNLINKSSCKEILDIYRCFDDAIPKFEILGSANNYITVESIKSVKIKIMSDSICAYIDVSIKDALLCLIVVCMSIQSTLLDQKEPVLVRGAIVRDKIYANGDITFGPALTKAYLMEEKNAKYPRIIVTKQVVNQGTDDCSSMVVKQLYDMLLFRDVDNFYSLDSLIFIDDESLYQLSTFVSETLDSTTDESIREKHLYLAKIVEGKMNGGN